MAVRTVYLIDEDPETLTNLTALIAGAPDLVVVGRANGGRPALNGVARARAEVIVVSLGLRDIDCFGLIRGLTGSLNAHVIVTTDRIEPRLTDLARRNGAADVIVKPYRPDELLAAIRRAPVGVGVAAQDDVMADSESRAQAGLGTAPTGIDAKVADDAAAPPPATAAPAAVEVPNRPADEDVALGHVVTVCAAKGGVGKTTLAVNLAAALARLGGPRVALVDLDLEFGAAAALLGCRSLATIVDLVRQTEPLSPEIVNRALLDTGAVGVNLLAAPASPDLASLVERSAEPDSPNGIRVIIDILRRQFDWVVIDTAASLRPLNRIAFELAEIIYVVTTPDIPTIHNTAKFLDKIVTQPDRDRERIRVVLNHADGAIGLTVADVATGLDYPIRHELPRDHQATGWSANCGRPMVCEQPNSRLAQAIMAISRGLVDVGDPQAAPARRPVRSWLRRTAAQR